MSFGDEVGRNYMSENNPSLNRFIENFRDGTRVNNVYLAKTKNTALTKNGKEYLNVTLQDRTGTIDAKIWDPYSPGISEFSVLDYVYVEGNVSLYNGVNQLSIQRLSVAREGSFFPEDFLPVSKRNREEMKREFLEMIAKLENPYLKKLLENIFVQDKKFMQDFSIHSAAKTVHHSYVGGLLEHTLSVAQLCAFYAAHYPDLNKDILVSAALCHDIGKMKELSDFPKNDYSDEGQLLGHIMIGYTMLSEKIAEIPDFPEVLRTEFLHCILSHHGELEFGSPKKPATMEALALAFADNTDAKLETMREFIEQGEKSGKAKENAGWIGYNKLLESNVRKSMF